MKNAILILLFAVGVAALAPPVDAGPPMDGVYTSTDIGGLMLPGRYSELWSGGKLSVDNTLNEESWDGSALGTQWHWYCPWIAAAPTLLVNTVNGAGNGQKIWQVTYAGGYCWLDGYGPWAGGDPYYSGPILSWTAIVTETYVNFVEVGTVRNHNASANFTGYINTCMNLSITNTVKLGDTSTGPLPADYPHFWDWFGCTDVGTAGPGEWGNVDSITLAIVGCTMGVQETSWGAVKARYRD